MAEIVFGLATEQGVPVGGEMRADGVADGSQVVFDINLPATVDAAQGWWFSIPANGVLGTVVSFGVDVSNVWVLAPDGFRYHYFFGLSGIENRISVRVTLAGDLDAVAQGETVIDAAIVAYPVVVFTAAEQEDILAYLRGAIRVEVSDENDVRLLALFRSGLREVEAYCNHALIKRMFTSTIVYVEESEGPFLFSVNGRWRALQSVAAVTTSGVPVTVERNGHFYGRSGLLYRATFDLGPFDGPEIGLAEDVMEALARLVGFRWDGGIFQRSGLWQSGCLDGVSRYVNREAAII